MPGVAVVADVVTIGLISSNGNSTSNNSTLRICPYVRYTKNSEYARRMYEQKSVHICLCEREVFSRAVKALRCQAQVHRSQVVSPSAATLSSRNGGRGGGGTKRPFHRPFSLASKANGDSNVSSSMAFDHQSSSAAGNKFLIDVAFVPTSLMGAVASKSAVIEGSYGDNS
ncbi:hypothetical protein GQX74_004245 [Glossina fuscipes]|nr:hypothetical protein GQX74_004245 [Glossina fuscipes]